MYVLVVVLFLNNYCHVGKQAVDLLIPIYTTNELHEVHCYTSYSVNKKRLIILQYKCKPQISFIPQHTAWCVCTNRLKSFEL